MLNLLCGTYVLFLVVGMRVCLPAGGRWWLTWLMTTLVWCLWQLASIVSVSRRWCTDGAIPEPSRSLID
jgi:hypothetical protein